MTLWTDYPIEELGDKPHEDAPIRECKLLTYDRDKYCTIEVEGIETSIKRGYIYRKPGRCGEVNALSHSAACRITRRNGNGSRVFLSIMEGLKQAHEWAKGDVKMRVTIPGQEPRMMTAQEYHEATSGA